MSPMLNLTDDETLTLLGLLENEHQYATENPAAFTDEKVEQLEHLDDKLSEALGQ